MIMPKGIFGAIMILVGLGLVLRFGRDSNTLLSTTFSGINSTLDILTLQNFNSNGV